MRAEDQETKAKWVSAIKTVNMLYSRKKNFDSHVHFKCSHKDGWKKLSISRNIRFNEFMQLLKNVFECEHEHTISCKIICLSQQ